MSTQALNIVINGRDNASAALSRIDRTLGGIAGRITGILAGVAAGAAAFFSTRALVSAANDIDRLAKSSDRLGVPVERLQAVRLQADLTGTSASALESSMGRMLRTIGDAAGGSRAAEEALGNLGLTTEDLANLDADQALGLIADRLNDVEGVAARASAAQAIFGRGAMEIDGILRAGSAGLQDRNDEIDRMGIALSRVDAAKVEQANDAMTRLRTMAQGLTQRLVVELAPAVTGIVDLISSGLERLGGADNIMRKIVNGAVTIADFLDHWIWQPLRNGMEFLMVAQMRVYQFALNAIDTIGRGVVGLINLIPGVEMSFTGFFGDLADTIGGVADELFTGLMERLDNPPPANRIRTWLDERRREADEAAQATAAAATGLLGALAGGDGVGDTPIDRLITQLQRQAETFGMASREAQLYQAAMEGATQAQLDQARALIEQLDAMEAQQELARQGQQVFEATRTDAEKRAAEIERLDRLLSAGAITADTFERALDQLQETIRGGRSGRGRTGVEAIESRFLTRAPGQDVALRTERHAARTAQELGTVRGLVNQVTNSVRELVRIGERGTQVQIVGVF